MPRKYLCTNFIRNELLKPFKPSKHLKVKRSLAFLTNDAIEFQILATIKEKDLCRHSKLCPGNTKIVPDPLRLYELTLK